MAVNEYLSDELTSDSDDKKRMYRTEKRAEKKLKDKRRRQYRPLVRGSSQPTFPKVSANLRRSASAGDHAACRDAITPRRPRPCFKISV